jgi:predicted DNA-binding transcriptional regulator AlpA
MEVPLQEGSQTQVDAVVAINRHARRAQAAGVELLPSGLAPALDTPQAALYTGLAEKTLEGLRCRGGGPRFVRYGRKAVRYLVADLDEWMNARAVSSTSVAA